MAQLFTIIGVLSVAMAWNHVKGLASTGRKVLLLCDLDDTVLRMPGYDGSDTWFRKQAELISSNASFQQGRIAVDTEHLKKLLLSIYEVTSPVPCDGNDTLNFISSCKQLGVHIVFVTARGPETRYVTERHIHGALGLSADQYLVLLCNGKNKATTVKTYINVSIYDDLIFMDDRFDHIKDMIDGLVIEHGRQTLTCFHLVRSHASQNY